MKIKISALKRFPKSKDYKFTKLPAQKAPDRFLSSRASDIAEKSARAKLGEAPEYMGMSQKSILDMASESYAMKVSDKMFTKTLAKEMSASRKRTATFIKQASSNIKKRIGPKKVTPKFVVPRVQYKKSADTREVFRFPKQAGQTITAKSKIVPSKGVRKAKSKGAMKSYMIAQRKSDAAFTKITERFTARSKGSMFKKPIKTPSKEPYSLDTREVQYLKKLRRDMGF